MVYGYFDSDTKTQTEVIMCVVVAVVGGGTSQSDIQLDVHWCMRRGGTSSVPPCRDM